MQSLILQRKGTAEYRTRNFEGRRRMPGIVIRNSLFVFDIRRPGCYDGAASSQAIGKQQINRRFPLLAAC
jgi:hypothetical protein